jgi:hypothetical protein
MEKQIPKIIIGFFIFLAIFGIINSLYLSKKEKIYTVALIYEKSESGKRGRTYYFRYHIGKMEFKGNVGGLNRFMTNKNGYIFVELLKDDYEHYYVLEFKKVPECFSLQDVPEKGWDKLPEKFKCK